MRGCGQPGKFSSKGTEIFNRDLVSEISTAKAAVAVAIENRGYFLANQCFQHSAISLILNEPNLLFNPFNEEAKIDPFAAVGERFDIPLNEDTMNPNFVPVKDPFE